ncbi:MAG: O-methyltransferase [Bacteroidia bacterium]
MEFISEQLAAYCEAHTSPESDLLQQLNRETHAKVLNPRMLSGHLQGRFLAMISRLYRPQVILEIGTYTGYSALCLCEGLPSDGKLITIDINDELEEFAKRFFDASSYANNIVQHIGDARNIIPGLNITPDLVFIDADKENYPTYFQLVLPLLKKGGIILADNVLWSGHVLKPLERQDHETTQLTAFNEMVIQHPETEVIMLPVRDGLSIIRKK